MRFECDSTHKAPLSLTPLPVPAGDGTNSPTVPVRRAGERALHRYNGAAPSDGLELLWAQF